MSSWFTGKVRMERTNEEGLQKKVTEPYVVEALNYTEAEKRLLEEMEAYVSGELEVVKLDRAGYAEVLDGDGEFWVEVKVEYITLDERTAKEKRSTNRWLVQADNITAAKAVVERELGKTMIDYKITGTKETKFLDVFRYKPSNSPD